LPLAKSQSLLNVRHLAQRKDRFLTSAEDIKRVQRNLLGGLSKGDQLLSSTDLVHYQNRYENIRRRRRKERRGGPREVSGEYNTKGRSCQKSGYWNDSGWVAFGKERQQEFGSDSLRGA